jgi:hypothetical protein
VESANQSLFDDVWITLKAVQDAVTKQHQHCVVDTLCGVRVGQNPHPQGQKYEIFTPRNGRGEWKKWFLEGAFAEVGESFDLQRCTALNSKSKKCYR